MTLSSCNNTSNNIKNWGTQMKIVGASAGVGGLRDEAITVSMVISVTGASRLWVESNHLQVRSSSQD